MAYILYKCLLGTSAALQVQSEFRRRKFSQMEESCPQNVSTSPCGLVAYVLAFHLDVMGLIPAESGSFSCWIKNPWSSSILFNP